METGNRGENVFEDVLRELRLCLVLPREVQCGYLRKPIDFILFDAKECMLGKQKLNSTSRESRGLDRCAYPRGGI